jgi:hypothetical protein
MQVIHTPTVALRRSHRVSGIIVALEASLHQRSKEPLFRFYSQQKRRKQATSGSFFNRQRKRIYLRTGAEAHTDGHGEIKDKSHEARIQAKERIAVREHEE